MSWYVPFNRLSEKQQEILQEVEEDPDNSHWIQGFAGTGKTLLLVHLIERMAAGNPERSLCFITYTNALVDLVKTNIRENGGTHVDICTHTQFLRKDEVYDNVFLDEAQDISEDDLEEIDSLAEHIVIAGDPDQRIYEGSATGDEIRNLFEPEEHKLVEIHRLTNKLRQVAMAILPSAEVVEGNVALNKAETSIRQMHFNDNQAQAGGVWEEASKRARLRDPCVILFPNHRLIYSFSEDLSDRIGLPESPPIPKKQENGPRDYGPFNRFWEKNGKNLVYLGSGFGTLPVSNKKPIVYLMTFHSSKGLDFRNVFIPYMDSGMQIIGKYRLNNDPDADKRLLFVAVTRSRKDLFLCHYGKPSKYFNKLPKDVVVKVEMGDGRKKDTGDEFF